MDGEKVMPEARAADTSQGQHPDLPAHRFRQRQRQAFEQHKRYLSAIYSSPERHLDALESLETETTRQQDGFWGPAVENPEGMQFYPTGPAAKRYVFAFSSGQGVVLTLCGRATQYGEWFGRWRRVAYQWLESRFFLNKGKRLPNGKHVGSERWNM